MYNREKFLSLPSNSIYMASSTEILNTFTTRMRQMILRFTEVKKENEELYAMVDKREKEIAQLKEQLGQAERDYNSLKMARMLEVTDGDVEGAKKRLAGLEKERLNIRLHVYDTDIPVKVDREDEYFYREAAKLISSTVNKYAEVFKTKKSEKEILYMAMIDIALRYEKEKGHNDTSEYDNILSSLTKEIERIL